MPRPSFSLLRLKSQQSFLTLVLLSYSISYLFKNVLMLPWKIYPKTPCFLTSAPYLLTIISSLDYDDSPYSILHKAARVILNTSLITWLEMFPFLLTVQVKVLITTYKALCEYQGPWLHLFSFPLRSLSSSYSNLLEISAQIPPSLKAFPHHSM